LALETVYSARTLAHSWEAAKMTPPEFAAIRSEAFGRTDLLIAVPEHKTVLPRDGRESRFNALTLVQHPDG
jgi:hypothetical protein